MQLVVMNEDQVEIIKQVRKEMIKLTKIIEICNLYRLHNEEAKGCMDMICNLIYGENNNVKSL